MVREEGYFQDFLFEAGNYFFLYDQIFSHVRDNHVLQNIFWQDKEWYRFMWYIYLLDMLE